MLVFVGLKDYKAKNFRKSNKNKYLLTESISTIKLKHSMQSIFWIPGDLTKPLLVRTMLAFVIKD